MSTPNTRELRPRVSMSNNGINGNGSERRMSIRRKVPVTTFKEPSLSPSPLKMKVMTRRSQGSAIKKVVPEQPLNGERKRRKIERNGTSAANDSTISNLSPTSSDLETERSSSVSSAFKSPVKQRSKSARVLRSRKNPAAATAALKLVKKAKGLDVRKRGSNDSDPGPSSSMTKNTKTKTKGPAAKRKADSSTCDSDVSDNDGCKVKDQEVTLNSIESPPQCPLPCRELQFEQILKFIKDNIKEKNSGCLYVSGVPGSGKTAIVQSVIDVLGKVFPQPKKTAESPPFKHVYINGLSLGSPDRIWKRFYHGLHHDKIKLSSQTALKKLGSYFETKLRVPVVLVIDELDQLLDKQQSILYTLLEWASHPSTMFSLVAIFNTMNLPENVFASRTSSRMGLSRVIFPPYNHDQLQTIVSNFLGEQSSSKLNPNAISLLSRKVASLSGDARRALEISKRAVEIVEEGSHTGAKAVDEAFKEIFSSPKIDTVKDCSMLEQLFLRTVSTEQQRTGIEETTLMTVQSNIVTLAPFEGLQWSPDQFLNAASRLVSMKLIVAENDSSSLHKKISLNIPVEDINYALDINANATTNGHQD